MNLLKRFRTLKLKSKTKSDHTHIQDALGDRLNRMVQVRPNKVIELYNLRPSPTHFYGYFLKFALSVFTQLDSWHKDINRIKGPSCFSSCVYYITNHGANATDYLGLMRFDSVKRKGSIAQVDHAIVLDKRGNILFDPNNGDWFDLKCTSWVMTISDLKRLGQYVQANQ